MTDIMTPTLGESVTEATVARWTKKAGDAVRKDEVLVELETDKVSLEVVAPEDGVLTDIAAGEGETVEPGALLGRVSARPGQLPHHRRRERRRVPRPGGRRHVPPGEPLHPGAPRRRALRCRFRSSLVLPRWLWVRSSNSLRL
jgi:pyruvate/2-oxoglutarate dehydrogenase complex dihydrolipoamide acyltransferase (E2) component